MNTRSETNGEVFLQAALAEARAAAAEGEVPVGAVIVRDGKILVREHNRTEQMHDATAHAEMLCIRKACELLGTRHLSGCSLFVTLEPCAMCTGALMTSQTDLCVYAAEDAEAGCCGSVYDLPADPSLKSRLCWRKGPQQQEAAALLRTFFEKRRKETN